MGINPEAGDINYSEGENNATPSGFRYIFEHDCYNNTNPSGLYILMRLPCACATYSPFIWYICTNHLYACW